MNASDRPEQHVDHRARIAGSWALVAIPLAYGLFNAAQAAAGLFTG